MKNMKSKYRIIEYGNKKYMIQSKNWLLGWASGGWADCCGYFNSLKEAKEWIRKQELWDLPIKIHE